VIGTKRCHIHHRGYVVSGRLAVELAGGDVIELGPGDVYETPPDHDGRVVGDEPFVAIEVVVDTPE
jgi:quercetin dioxygenase-like cupin family protein